MKKLLLVAVLASAAAITHQLVKNIRIHQHTSHRLVGFTGYAQVEF